METNLKNVGGQGNSEFLSIVAITWGNLKINIHSPVVSVVGSNTSQTVLPSNQKIFRMSLVLYPCIQTSSSGHRIPERIRDVDEAAGITRRGDAQIDISFENTYCLRWQQQKL